MIDYDPIYRDVYVYVSDAAPTSSTHSNAAITIIPFFADMMFVDQLEEKIRAYHRRAEQAWVRVMGPSSICPSARESFASQEDSQDTQCPP